MSDREQLYRIADCLQELAQCCRKAADGDTNAIDTVKHHIDHYWYGIVVGTRRIESLLDAFDPRVGDSAGSGDNDNDGPTLGGEPQNVAIIEVNE